MNDRRNYRDGFCKFVRQVSGPRWWIWRSLGVGSGGAAAIVCCAEHLLTFLASHSQVLRACGCVVSLARS